MASLVQPNAPFKGQPCEKATTLRTCPEQAAPHAPAMRAQPPHQTTARGACGPLSRARRLPVGGRFVWFMPPRTERRLFQLFNGPGFIDGNLSNPVAVLGTADQFLCLGREHAGACCFLIIRLAIGHNLNAIDVLANHMILACGGGKNPKKTRFVLLFPNISALLKNLLFMLYRKILQVSYRSFQFLYSIQNLYFSCVAMDSIFYVRTGKGRPDIGHGLFFTWRLRMGRGHTSEAGRRNDPLIKTHERSCHHIH
ncbi:hypothetical protein ACM0P6_08415 [Komagataeibacter sucrofermentans]|uniref:hypothetical protein n=1 Tax=Komagataeibacter sucrofermentans TaxID=1053551 RepID=UPI0011B840A2|nr:hypothetical protein [Komagataeibacter sucrofermentans]